MTQHKQIEEFENLDALATPQDVVSLDGAAALPVARRDGARAILKRFLIVGVAVGALAAAGYFGQKYWTVGRFAVATDDAYVKADSTTISPKVAGYIAAVAVGDNEVVKAGQVLARIDDRDFKVAVEQARADVEAAQAAIGNKQAAIVAQQSIIDGAGATVAADEANQTFAEQENKRYSDLASSGFGSQQNAQGASSRVLAVPRQCGARPGGARQRDPPARRDQGRARAGPGESGARGGVAGPGRSSISPIRSSPPRPTARSATAPCASANMCRPERS